MNPAAQNSDEKLGPPPTATYKVRFGKKNGTRANDGKNREAGRIPKVTRLLALAHRIEGMIRSGELRDWAEAARLIGVTRARMTQIANLLLLGPEIQEAILNLPPVLIGSDPVTEHDLRRVAAWAHWLMQKMNWLSLRQRPKRPSAA